MRVLLDNNVHRGVAHLIAGHDINHARELGWGELEKRDLIAAAEEQGFDVMITADKNLRFQLPFSNRNLTIPVLNSLLIKWSSIAPLAPRVQEMLGRNPPKRALVVINP